MKKSLIALAVLATSGAAMAQSSVTLYGRIDTSVGQIKDTGSSSTNKSAVTKMFSGGDGGLTSPRWGMRGSEDLGGGLKANFQLESRFFADEGSLDGVQFKGASWVGLSGGFGEVKLGRSTTVYDDVIALSVSSSVFDSAFTPTGNGVYNSTLNDSTTSKTKIGAGAYSSRFDNKLTYLSPNLGGFYAGIDYALDEDASKKAEKMAVKAGYKAGPLHVALGFQDEKTTAEFLALSAAYDFGMASISAGYSTTDAEAASKGEDTEFTLGVNVPFGAFAVSAGFASSKTEKATTATNNVKTSGFALGSTYAFSKRTKAYAGFRSVESKSNTGTKIKDETLYSVGLRHDF